MTDKLRIALAQLNPVVGDIAGNLQKAVEARRAASVAGAELIVFTELFLTGYPPEDLVLKPAFQRVAKAAVEDLARQTADGGPAVLIGAPWAEEGKLYNAVLHLDRGEIKGRRYKVHLPNYSVFDEPRVFASGPMPGPFSIRGVRIGAPICEDIWYPDVVECLEESGAELLLVPNGSPYEFNKPDARLQLALSRIRESGLPLAYVNQLGGQDELVFDGGSFVLNADFSLALQMPAWEEKITCTDWTRGEKGWVCAPGEKALVEEGDESLYLAVVQGLRDYVKKNRFPGVVLGLSGGIDSALVAAIAVDALGADKVHCVMLPYRYTSSESLTDAEACAKLLGVRYDVVPIEEPVAGFTSALEKMFEGTQSGVTEENLQSRTRGVVLMAISNKFGSMLLTTGNKSEVSAGYATIYGDMNGGFNPIKDLYKSRVFKLSNWRNTHMPKGCLGPEGRVIPERIITRPPSAELRPDQKDEDSLPPYEVMDDILHCLIEEEMSVTDIVARGHDRDLVKRIEHLLYISEYKRRQAAPGVKVTKRNFGRDRRYPIVNGFRDQDL
ncbi:NAD+ synthetase [Parvibaculum lavamentivorans DS-1]|uniref:Glutamine-dependent NAD(+) synthetase n=1 Tax=Parvibaculum lavamentivorans (strain DS-1 / DSM 13023 / NCIMB 13966) TaxID=402881 RepID=A7HS41_PARL1|nr:NAD+ synthase [Parvibaculum lavamentivorans]ABS62724.1 NAD+ synthetase [Parvibaculum lavamentivorans DS-1]